MSALTILIAGMAAFSSVRQGNGGRPFSASGRDSFSVGFESPDDYAGSYITRSGQLGTTFHELSGDKVRSGARAHKAWIRGSNGFWRFDQDGPNHRGYPTFQFHRSGGGFRGPTLITLWVWLDVALKRGEWFSFATLSADASDRWKRVVCVNLDDHGFVHLMHVPRHGEGQRTFQTTSTRFPLRQWVKLSMFIDFDSRAGRAIVCQDGALVSAAHVEGGRGVLEQAHFGMYAAPGVDSGVVYNDDLEIRSAPDISEPLPGS